jgi:hypothetical protein
MKKTGKENEKMSLRAFSFLKLESFVSGKFSKHMSNKSYAYYFSTISF